MNGLDGPALCTSSSLCECCQQEAETQVRLQSKVGQGYKFSSVGSRFKRQLGELMEALHRMEPHYIRCIKPNSFNRSADSPLACVSLLLM